MGISMDLPLFIEQFAMKATAHIKKKNAKLRSK